MSVDLNMPAENFIAKKIEYMNISLVTKSICQLFTHASCATGYNCQQSSPGRVPA
jgi:hypothetical protein